MGKLIIKYEHSGGKQNNMEEWEMSDVKAYELFTWFSEIVYKVMRWK